MCASDILETSQTLMLIGNEENPAGTSGHFLVDHDDRAKPSFFKPKSSQPSQVPKFAHFKVNF